MLFCGEGGKTMKVTVLIRHDHEALQGLFNRFKQAAARNQNGKKELFSEIHREITIHSQMESEVFYPALTATTSARAMELVARAESEHDAVNKLLDEISGMNATDKNFESRME